MSSLLPTYPSPQTTYSWFQKSSVLVSKTHMVTPHKTNLEASKQADDKQVQTSG